MKSNYVLLCYDNCRPKKKKGKAKGELWFEQLKLDEQHPDE